jgi:hypothetical protein
MIKFLTLYLNPDYFYILKNINFYLFFLKINIFLMFLDHFDACADVKKKILKIKNYYFDIFSSKKHFKK